jgi:hypothetical protein
MIVYSILFGESTSRYQIYLEEMEDYFLANIIHVDYDEGANFSEKGVNTFPS